MFIRFAEPIGAGIDPNTGQPLPVKRPLKFKRKDAPAPIEMVLETRGHEHAQRVLATLQEEGYEAQVLR